jgi:serine/threonine-protein kinase
MLAYAYAVAGDRARATTLLREIEGSRARESHNFAIARVHLGLGDHDAALASLRRAAERHDAFFAESMASPIFDPIRQDPRFAEVVRMVGIDPVVMARR